MGTLRAMLMCIVRRIDALAMFAHAVRVHMWMMGRVLDGRSISRCGACGSYTEEEPMQTRTYKARRCVLSTEPKYLRRKRGMALRVNLVLAADVVVPLRQLARDRDVAMSTCVEEAVRRYLKKEEYLP
jgi:hypothetical protein